MMVADTQAGDAVELLPCPFCGAAPDKVQYVCEQGRFDYAEIECRDCSFSLEGPNGISGVENAMDAAATRWNTRIASRASALDEAGEALEDTLSVCEYVLSKPDLYDDTFAQLVHAHVESARAALAKIKEAGNAKG